MTQPNASCDQRQIREEYLFGMLQGPALAAYKAHLDTCALCQTEVAQHQSWTSALQAAAPEVTPLQEHEWEGLFAQIPFQDPEPQLLEASEPKEANATQAPEAATKPIWFAWFSEWLRPWLVPATVFASLAFLMFQLPKTQTTPDASQVQLAVSPKQPPIRARRAAPAPRVRTSPPRRVIAAAPVRSRPKPPRLAPRTLPPQAPRAVKVRQKALARATPRPRPRKAIPKARPRDKGPSQITTLLATNNPKIQVIWIQQKNFPEQPFKPDKDTL